MKISILFFASIKEYAGTNTISLNIEDKSTVANLKQEIANHLPELKDLLPTALVSINHEFAFPEDTVPPDAEIAIFPPVSGGQEKPTIIEIKSEPFSVDEIMDNIVGPSTGAMCIFSGIVRAQNDEVTEHNNLAMVEQLNYEAYSPMAETKMYQVASEVRSLWPNIYGIAIYQRIGSLEPGQQTVMIACTSAHRNSGVFEAARYGIDRLKEIVPIWKQEIGEKDSTWVRGTYQPDKNDVKQI
ncbi:MAG: molybdopterin converting factor [Chloroflexi bacterium]|nr:molybdopterin converting factor [Chloroflexota bacterium]MBS61089.1 molybdopterin converting factor [Anaerolineaceae bacterium]HCU79616.1 molybdopterin converting factor [Chloroflexota bacterium]|tara:strand:+ start:1622 stop:2347 length:726 start_codon:yes stop_codon:yes gene_type:complete